MPRRLTIAAAIAALTTLTGSIASASADTRNHGSRYMNSGDPGACTTRTINLRGTYRWQVYGYHWTHPLKPAKARTVRLHGRYAWQDCIYRRPANGTLQYYQHGSLFRNTATGGKVFLSHPITAYGAGTYDWGSIINNVRS